jgi:hypothetical protein
MPTSTALISQTLRAGNGRNRYPDLVLETGRAEIKPKFHGAPRAQPIGKVSMKVLMLNSGSSSLKFQLIATDFDRNTQNNDERLCRGLIERIGGEAIISVQPRKGLKQTFTASLSDISGSLQYLVRWIASDESGITAISSLSEIHAVGHRVVHGGGLFTESTVITDEVLKEYGEPPCLGLRKRSLPAGDPILERHSPCGH